MRGFTLVDTKTFEPITSVPGDIIEFTYTHKNKPIYHKAFKFDKKTVVNTIRVYRADEFEGMENCFIAVIGMVK